MGCIFPMDIFPMDDEHREDSPHFNNGSLPNFETHPNPIFYKGKIRVGQFHIRVRDISKLENSSNFHSYHF